MQVVSKYEQIVLLTIVLSLACLIGVDGQGPYGQPGRPGQSRGQGQSGRPGQAGRPGSAQGGGRQSRGTTKTFRFGKKSRSAKAKSEKDLVKHFSKSRKRLKKSDMSTGEFRSLNSAQKGRLLQNMPNINILQVQATDLQGAQLLEGSVYRWDQINPNVNVAFKGRIISRRHDFSSMRMLEADSDFTDKIQNDNKTESMIVWSILGNMASMMQIATNGPPVTQWDINFETNFLYAGDIQLNSEQARDIEDDIVAQIWAGNLTADYLSTKTSLSRSKLQPMVKKLIRIQNPIIDEAAEVIKRAEIPNSRMRELLNGRDIESLLQDPDFRVDILEVVKAKKMNPNMKVRIETPPGFRSKRSVDSGNQANVNEDEETDEELIPKVQYILNKENDHGLPPDNNDSNDNDETAVLDKVQDGNQYGLNRTKQHLAHLIVKRKMGSGFSKWNRIIKYTFGTGLTGSNKQTIRDALRHWESETCIRFQYHSTVFWTPHLLFVGLNSKSICGSSPLGKHPWGNKISIGSRCWNIGVVAHEVGHSLGFWHEHSRPDRNDYVTVTLDNVKDGAKHNFVHRPWRYIYTQGVLYDLGSLMHYPSTAFAKPGTKTIIPRDTNMKDVMGQRKGLSFYDVKLFNLHYCLHFCPSVSLVWNRCRNRGYRDPNDCTRCKCPTGFKGDWCHLYDTNTQICGATFRTATSAPQYLNSPGYLTPGYYSPNQRCVWMLRAPSGHQVRVQFTGIFAIQSSKHCSTSHVELRYSIPAFSGPRFCGTSAETKRFTSVGQIFMVIFHSGPNSNHFRGFRLRYWLTSCGICDRKYSPAPACKTEVLKTCYKEFRTECGLFGWFRCTRHRRATCPSIIYKCCHGKLVDKSCIVGCGGCENQIVRNQPACRKRPVLTRTQRVRYTVICGLFGWGRCTRYKYIVATYLGPTTYNCCYGYRLSRSRCIK